MILICKIIENHQVLQITKIIQIIQIIQIVQTIQRSPQNHPKSSEIIQNPKSFKNHPWQGVGSFPGVYLSSGQETSL
jgi:hypothetical protein